jgi:hypothetical protein
VQAAPSGFNITDTLTAIDVTQLAGAKDVSVMAAGAQALQSLASFADAGTATAAQKAAMQTVIDAKATSMISALATDVTSLIDDPKTLGQVGVCLVWSGTLATAVPCALHTYASSKLVVLPQVVSAVATLSKAMTSLSADAKSKLTAVGKAGLASAQLSTEHITPDSASCLLGVLAAGNGISDSCKSPTGCQQSANVVQPSRHLLDEVSCNGHSVL